MSPKKSSFQGVSPVLLSSPFSIAANNSAIPDFGQLAYPFRKAIVVEEIRWSLRTVASLNSNLGAVVSTKLAFGNKYLMRDPVPVWLLGTMMDINQEQVLDNRLAAPTNYSSYRWRLPEPLYLEAGEVLGSWFTRGNDGFGTIDGEVSYVGRTVAPYTPRPRVIPVPYVAPFVTTLGQTYQQSNKKHLFNPFGVDLRVQRLTGRLANVVGTAVSAARGITPTTAGSAISILMNDSWGGKMVNNNTGPGDVFDCLRAAWTVDTIMPPKGVYEVRAWNIPATQQLHVAVVGVREERP